MLLIPFEEVLNLQPVPNTELRPVCGINLSLGFRESQDKAYMTKSH